MYFLSSDSLCMFLASVIEQISFHGFLNLGNLRKPLTAICGTQGAASFFFKFRCFTVKLPRSV